MSEMIERVARALHAKHGRVTEWQDYIGQARTAIAAMRAPTEAMCKAALRDVDPGLFLKNQLLYQDAVWFARIDEALKEKADAI